MIEGVIMQKELKTFPEDWRSLDDERILENLKYIKKHYHKYERTSPDHLTLRIGNVVFTKLGVTLPSGYISVNRMHLGPLNKESYDIASKIFTSGIKEKKSEKIKRQILCTLVSIPLGVLILALCYEIERNAKENRKQQQIEQMKNLLKDYQSEQAKSKTVNIDSLINQHVR